MMFPVVAYAPTAATKPSIAAQPLNLSASGVMSLYLLLIVNCELSFILKKAGCDPTCETVVNYSCEQTYHRKATINLLCVLPIVFH